MGSPEGGGGTVTRKPPIADHNQALGASFFVAGGPYFFGLGHMTDRSFGLANDREKKTGERKKEKKGVINTAAEEPLVISEEVPRGKRWLFQSGVRAIMKRKEIGRDERGREKRRKGE